MKQEIRQKVSDTLRKNYQTIPKLREGAKLNYHKRIARGEKFGFQKGHKLPIPGVILAYQRILDEVALLEAEGYRCIPLGIVVPDIVAIKDNKVYAFEIERQTPNYKKYDKQDYKKYFDEVRWVFRSKK